MKRVSLILFALLNLYAFTGFAQNTQIGGIINAYTPVLAFNPCDNKITAEDAASFRINDTVLIIQMKGAIIDSGNTSSFGTVMDYRSAGNYEINYIKSINGNIIELKNVITRPYNIPDGRVQLIRVPYFQNATVTSTLTCLPWDGRKGGVMIFFTEDSVILNANIDVSGKGFRGGGDPYSNPPSYNCYENNFFYPENPDLASEKGEGIALISPDKSFGKGAIANGGGGGNSHNSGGGGGSNGANGGFGGYNFEGGPCSNVPFDNRGLGGKSLTYSNTMNKIYMGGGGGAGHTNNPQAFEAKGGNGAGIIIISADKILFNNNKILANGIDGLSCGNSGPECHEGMGGGGAGGAILLEINNYLNNGVVEAKGGNGANMTASGFLKVGPGGGGSGGILWISDFSLPSSINLITVGGNNGVATGYGNDNFGATSGENGSPIFNLQILIDNTPFRKNIDSIKIKETLVTCSNFDFGGMAFTNRNQIISWHWDFGDNTTSANQNVSHNYILPGSYNVKLIVTDVNGCTDSTFKIIKASFMMVDAGPGDTICVNNSVILQPDVIGSITYSWTPAIYLNDPSLLNPVATPITTTVFYLTANNSDGCSLTDSVRIEVRSPDGFMINPPTAICLNNSAQLFASGGDTYNWTPAAFLNNTGIANPVASPQLSTPYSVIIADTLCGYSATLSTNVTVWPLPEVVASKSNDIDCTTSKSRLNATGASSYNWTPVTALSNPNTSSPEASPNNTIQYTVTGINSFGCINKDSIEVKVSQENKSQFLMPTAFTPNNDGLNDCYRIKYWGHILELEFNIYNRWGERIFFTNDPSTCWDGTLRGVKQNPGVFVYVIKARTSCQDYVFRKGTFTLLR